MKQWTSLASLMLLLLYAGAVDGLMEALGLGGSMAAGAAVLSVSWRLLAAGRGASRAKRNPEVSDYGNINEKQL